MKKGLYIILLLFVALGSVSAQNAQVTTGARWSAEKANAWYNSHKWMSGANYIPANAINQLEMWQADTFDPATIDKEFGWAEGLGFNMMRVFLHSLAYKQDPTGFKNRMDKFLDIADKHHIQIMFVFFDDCWNKVASPGKQPAPKTGIHNSGWMQDPGDPAYKEPANYPALEKYVKDILTRFGHDKRILLWDLYNEPGNSQKLDTSMPLLQNVFAWAKAANPDQPISSGIWRWDFEKLNAFQIMNSDVITYHNYEEPTLHLRVIQMLKTHNRPLICTEYMARTNNSRFSNVMPLLHKENVAAVNWGFVAGKTNTMYAWSTPMAEGGEPIEWFHDIFRPDGSAYRLDEVNLIKKLNSQKPGKSLESSSK